MKEKGDEWTQEMHNRDKKEWGVEYSYVDKESKEVGVLEVPAYIRVFVVILASWFLH